MSNITSTVLPIQRVMADATPLSWLDGLVIETSDAQLTVAFLDGSVSRLRLASAAELLPGEPVAYHPVAEILSAGRVAATARAV